jgi:hypothetical protein
VWHNNQRRKEINARKRQNWARTSNRVLGKQQNGRDEIVDKYQALHGWNERIKPGERFVGKRSGNSECYE